MKNLTRITAALLVLMLLCPLIPAAQADSGSYVTFHMNVRKNWMLSKYKVFVYLDNQMIGMMDQGDAMTFGAWLTSGMHTLRIEPAKSGAQACTWTLGALQSGTVITCTVHTKRKKVTLDDARVTLPDGKNVQGKADPDFWETAENAGKVLKIVRNLAGY